MRLPEWLFLNAKLFPELTGIDADARKRALAACRWKIFVHWQLWLMCIILAFFGIVLTGISGIFIIGFKMAIFNRVLITVAALLSLTFCIYLIYVARRLCQYYLAPHIIAFLTANSTLQELQAEHLRLQQLRRKSIKRGLLLIVPCFIGIMTISVLIVRYTKETAAPLKMPETLKTPRVAKMLPGLTKKIFLDDSRPGKVTDIVFRYGPGGASMETIIAGTKGALFSGKGLPVRFVPFEERQDHVKYIQLDPDGKHGFMNRGAWCSAARVMDENGHLLWSYGAGMDGVDDMASGDLDGDGVPEFIVGFNGGGGIHLLNNLGKKLWDFHDGNVWHVEIGDLDGSGQKKIVHSNAGGYITVRDIRGKIISKSKPEPYFSDFSMIRWPDETKPERLLIAEDNFIWIFDARANVLAKFPAPDTGNLGHGKGAVLGIKGKKPVLATIVDYENWHRSILYIHDPSGDLLYQEILPESCPAIALFPTDAALPGRLLIGCEGKVLEYQAQ